MRTARHHHAPLAAGPLVLDGPAHRYLARVLRLGVGATITLFDGAGLEASATIVRVDDAAARVELDVGVPGPASVLVPALELVLLVGLLKGDKLELVIQKATELGVTRIVPVEAVRAVVKLDPARATQRVARWRTIAAEAAKQCGRADLPEVTAPLALADALASAPAGPRLFVDEEHKGAGLAAALPDGSRAATVAIGPEGGWAPEERQAAASAGFTTVGLGPRTLRAETAALAAIAVVAHRLGDLGRGGNLG